MTPIAICFLVLAVLLVWGGLAASIVNLAKAPVTDDESVDDVPEDRPEGPVQRDL